MPEDRYCRNCGQELQPVQQFCGSCGRPVHATDHLPTPEADVSVPPPPQQAEDRSVPPQAPQARSGEGRVLSVPRGPVWGMLAVFLVLWVGVTVQERPALPAGKDLGFQIGYQIGAGLGPALGATLATAGIILVLGGIYYATGRKQGVTFREAVFNWPMVILAGLLTLPSLL